MYSVEQYIKHLRDDFATLSLRDDVECYLIFGSLVSIPSLVLNRDIDLCIVLKNRSERALEHLGYYLKSNFIEPDATVYFSEELESSIPFRDIGNGLFALEYFALGTLIHGKNIFFDMLNSISKIEYKRSLLEKIFDYILRLRRCFLVETDISALASYSEKYLQRVLIDILLYIDMESLSVLSKESQFLIFNRCAFAGLFPFEYFTSLNDNSSIQERIKCYKQIHESISVTLLKIAQNHNQ